MRGWLVAASARHSKRASSGRVVLARSGSAVEATASATTGPAANPT
jgi:hypothetical protein